jgi:copper homeostasis protein CutC
MLKIFETLFIDITKLTFGGVVLGAIMRQDVDIDTLLLRGIAAMLISLAAGLTFHYFNNPKKSK